MTLLAENSSKSPLLDISFLTPRLLQSDQHNSSILAVIITLLSLPLFPETSAFHTLHPHSTLRRYQSFGCETKSPATTFRRRYGARRGAVSPRVGEL